MKTVEFSDSINSEGEALGVLFSYGSIQRRKSIFEQTIQLVTLKGSMLP